MTTTAVERITTQFSELLNTLSFGAEAQEAMCSPGGDELDWTCSCGESSQYPSDMSLAFLKLALVHLDQGHSFTMKKS